MTASIGYAAKPFSGDAFGALLPAATRLLGLGEPTHGVEAFPELRNELFRHLVEHHGFRSIAIESDCLMALAADSYVNAGTESLEEVMGCGFSHGFGAYAANRALLEWMRSYNERRPEAERLRFYGFDGPLETMGAASPRPSLIAVHDYLASAQIASPWDRAVIDELAGADEQWSDEAAMMDATRSVGRTPQAKELRLIADDLREVLWSQSPYLAAATSADEFWRAELQARTAAGLLRYHAGMAGHGPARYSTLIGLRGSIMAENLEAIVGREARRGPALAFAHNQHLQRNKSQMRFADKQRAWWNAGAIMATRLGDEYAYAATTFGTRGVDDVPKPDNTLEGLLATLPYDRAVIDPGKVAEALDRKLTPRVPADHTYFALDPDALGEIDAVLFVKNV